MKNYLNYILENQKIYTEKDIEKRWKKKRDNLKILSNNIRKLKLKIDRDLSSDDDKTRIIACVVKIMEITGERVGNDISSEIGNFGISNLRKKHIRLDGDDITLRYKGKSNVEHEKTFKHNKVAKILKDLLKNDDDVFKTSDNISIKNKHVNRYLSEFDITSKDLRGFKCNRLMIKELNKIGKVRDEKERKKIFNEKLRKVAEEIGHTPATLKNHYLLPEIEQNFHRHGYIYKKFKL